MDTTVRHEDFGKDLGLLHEVIVTGRKVGADRDFWARLAHDQGLLANVVTYVNSLDKTALGARNNLDADKIPSLPHSEQQNLKQQSILDRKTVCKDFTLDTKLSAILERRKSLRNRYRSADLIDQCPLSTRVINCLTRIKVDTLRDVVGVSVNDLMALKAFDKRSLRLLHCELVRLGCPPEPGLTQDEIRDNVVCTKFDLDTDLWQIDMNRRLRMRYHQKPELADACMLSYRALDACLKHDIRYLRDLVIARSQITQKLADVTEEIVDELINAMQQIRANL